MGVTHHSTPIEKNDERVLVVQQIVDLIKDILDISAKCVPKCHGSEFPLRNLRALVAVTAGPRRCTDFLRLVRDAPSAATETIVVAATTSCGDGETPFARDRKNVSSLARGPSVASASVHSVRASSCGHSSSHASVVRPVLSRRSCATIASCHAVKRTHSAAASAVPTLEPRIA